MKVIVSTPFGAGWVSWNEDEWGRDLATWQPLIDFIESGEEMPTEKRDGGVPRDFPPLASLIEHLKEKFDLEDGFYLCTLGLAKASVEEIPDGVDFRIDEYDGSESVEIRDDPDGGWL